MASTQVLSTVLKFVPLLLMATAGLLFVKAGNSGAFNAGGTSTGGAVSAVAAIAQFSYFGIETAAVVGAGRPPRGGGTLGPARPGCHKPG